LTVFAGFGYYCKVSIGGLIRYKRRLRGLTQRELGEIIGVTGAAVSRWEQGVAQPKVGSLHGVAKALRCPVRELLAESAQTKTAQ
jgi:transcriptional regulator with XRE-family HTH domain